ncbi:MAG: SRPBCC family protein, partial [Myxococcales bacterium]|nr:SRPBCC family protein [Myxococcales bacterium]
MDATEPFWNKIAEKYAAKPVSNPDAYQAKLRVTRRLGHRLRDRETKCTSEFWPGRRAQIADSVRERVHCHLVADSFGGMFNILVRERIAVPLDVAFATVSDHEGFVRMPGVRTRILRAGDSDRCGLGCLREVRAFPGLRFVEEITAWSPPTTFEYRIRESTLPLLHEGSRLELRGQGDGTEVE